MLLMKDLDLEGRRVLIREDLNVPLDDGRITNERRIEAALPTLSQALNAGAAVMAMSHLGRPKEGEPDPALSLKPVARRIGELLHIEVRLVSDWLDGVDVEPGELVLCENVRFNVGEKKNDEALAKRMAALCDVFVMDAFGTAHRAQASTEGVARHAPVACAGPLLAGELDALARALQDPKRPLVALVGGSKVSTKLAVLDALSQQVDQLVVGGGIANTFIAAAGHDVGKSLYEADMVGDAKALLERGEAEGATIPVPTDVVVATEFAEEAEGTIKPVGDVVADEMILDIGPDSAAMLAAIMKDAGTIVWNGPVGVFEFPAFAEGTRVVSTAIADSDAFSVAGGGDTLAALDKFGIGDRISYISTGGGAFLEYLQGKELPAVAVLKSRAADG